MKLTPALLLVVAGSLASVPPAHCAVTLIAEGAIAGDAQDDSKLSGSLEDGTSPHNRIGGIGSAIAYSGHGNTYYVLPDRGPAAGKTSYINRLYRVDLDLTKTGDGRYRLEPKLKATRLLRSEDGQPFTGRAAAFDPTNSPQGLRLDPEGIRLSACGKTAFICDEYGPHLYEVDLESGKRLRSIAIPRKFMVDFPSDNPDEEKSKNLTGRQPNRGFEGLAITPDGSRLFAALQQPLLQDGALGADRKAAGVNCRILEVELKTGAVREYVYQLDRPANGVSEILAINDHELLLIEHDAKAAPETTFKKVFRVDVTGATDVRSVKALPVSGNTVTDGAASFEIKPLTKTVFVDLLQAGIPNMPEKVEGLAFGPDLADGRHLLIATSDNDFEAAHENRFWAFAVDPGDLAGYQPAYSATALSSAACPAQGRAVTKRSGGSHERQLHAASSRHTAQ